MQIFIVLLVLLGLTVIGFCLGRARAVTTVGGRIRELHSTPGYYGYFVALWCGLPALLLFAVWVSCEDAVIAAMVTAGLPDAVRGLPEDQLGLLVNDIRNIAAGDIASSGAGDTGVNLAFHAEHYSRLQDTGIWLMAAGTLAVAVAGLAFSRRLVAPGMWARNAVEKIVTSLLAAAAAIAILTTIGIILSLLFEALRFFEQVPITEFLFGTEWSPQIALRSDQVAASGSFGAVPIFAGTLMISTIAMIVAVPIGLFAAIYMAEYASSAFRTVAKPILEILAGIPTVVYGFFAALTVAPLFRSVGADIGLTISSESALAAGIVLGIMLIPFISSLSDDVITAVPDALREGSYGVGATQSETIRQVVLPAALPGIISSILLAVSRAIGETMIVVMAAGLSAKLSANPFEAVTTVTVQIVTLLVGDQEFDSPKTLAAFALGLVLFLVTLVINVMALHIVRHYRERYE